MAPSWPIRCGVPWVPVVCSPSIVSFKWVDWTQSLNLEYRPLVLPPSPGWEILKHFKIRMAERREVPPIAGARAGPGSDPRLLRPLRRRRRGGTGVKPVLNAPAKSAVKRMARPVRPLTPSRAPPKLSSKAARSQAYLSEERVLAERVERLEACRHASSRAGCLITW